MPKVMKSVKKYLKYGVPYANL